MAGDVPLKEYVDKAFEAHGKLLDARFQAQDDALKLAADELRHWKQEHNTFRGQLHEEITKAATPIMERVRKLESIADHAAGRYAVTSILISTLVALAISLGVVLFTKSV